jgi:hypothetical protein
LGNISPIFSRVGDVQGGVVLTTAANDYTGNNLNNAIVFQSDNTNGGYLQRLRFKALGTNVASVARIFFTTSPVAGGTEVQSPFTTLLSPPSGTPTGTPSASGGSLATGSYFAKIQALDQFGAPTGWSTETASVSVTGPSGSIAWAWSAVTGAVSYRIIVGMATGQEFAWFTSTTNSFTQTVPFTGTPSQIASLNDLTFNNIFYGEFSLPATTLIATAATNEMDYNVGVALPPGTNVLVGLGTTVAAGWAVVGIGGKY